MLIPITKSSLAKPENRLGLTKSGQGARIEALARSMPTLIVPGKKAL